MPHKRTGAEGWILPTENPTDYALGYTCSAVSHTGDKERRAESSIEVAHILDLVDVACL